MTAPRSGHTLTKFDHELATLRDLVLGMGGRVEEQLRHAVQALREGDTALARAVVQGDRAVDRMELQADADVAQLLALQAPLGVDLRTVLMLARTVNDLERVGDEAKKIAKTALAVHGEGAAGSAASLPALDDIAGMAQRALAMLRGALDALVRNDVAQAAALDADEDALDAAYKAAQARLEAWMAANAERIGTGVRLMFALKGLERVGDHAGNIAQYVFYLVEGRDVRHPKAAASTTPPTE